MPAPRSPPVTVSALASSPGVLVMESVRPAATARPAWVAPEASVFVPVRKGETLAFVPVRRRIGYCWLPERQGSRA